MSPSRRSPPFDIYQDPSPTFDPYQLHLPPQQLLQTRHAMPSLSQGAIASNVTLDPPVTAISYSPEKHTSSSPHPPLAQDPLFAPVYFFPPTVSQPPSASPTKNQPMYNDAFAPKMAQKPQRAYFPINVTPVHGEKENFYTSLHSDSLQQAGLPSLKRGAPEPAAPRDRSKKQKVVREEESSDPVEIPNPEDMPALSDDGKKPPFSYAQLIGMAILRAQHRRLTLAQIYKWISDTFAFYRDADGGWMNSIRHNLSLNKAFIKQERPKDDPGKGNYWALKPGTEAQFLKDKTGRRATNPESGPFFKPLPGDGSRPSTAPAMGAFALPPKPVRMVDSSKFPSEQELSSDATLPASDPDLPQDDQDVRHMPPPSSRALHSSPPQHMNSSPPVPAARHGPSPSAPSRVAPGANRKKRSSSFRDSGFFSSIESSVARPPYVNHLSSEADGDRPPIKRGRAEEEIARIRSSSYDSPIKKKSRPVHPESPLPTSSPMHGGDGFTFPPLTPNVRFEPPLRAPPTVSPNTHLRIHRDAIRDFVGTPAHGSMGLAVPQADTLSFSPAFAIHDDALPGTITLGASEFENAFGAFDDSFWYRGSPIKHSAKKRPMLQRATTTAGVLADITGTGTNRLASPFRMPPPPPQLGRASGSPFKMPRFTPSPTAASSTRLPDLSHDDDENLFDGIDLGSDPSDADGRLDIFKGFTKIGADSKEQERTQSNAKVSRPCLERSVTSLF